MESKYWQQEMLDEIDSLISCLRGNEEDISTLIERQLEYMPNDELEAYFRFNQNIYYIDNIDDFHSNYYAEFVENRY